MPSRTKSLGMKKIVTNSEIHLHHCLCESRGFTCEKQSPKVFNKKGVPENFAGLAGKNLCPSPTKVFFCQFYEIFENTFFTEHFRATAFDELA